MLASLPSLSPRAIRLNSLPSWYPPELRDGFTLAFSVLIESIPNRQTKQSDERLLEPRDLSSTIVVVDVDSGQVVRSVKGVLPVWMR